MTGGDWFTVAEAASEVGRSRRSIERWIKTGLPIQRVRGVRYIRGDDLFARYRLILITEPETRARNHSRAMS